MKKILPLLFILSLASCKKQMVEGQTISSDQETGSASKAEIDLCHQTDISKNARLIHSAHEDIVTRDDRASLHKK